MVSRQDSKDTKVGLLHEKNLQTTIQDSQVQKCENLVESDLENVTTYSNAATIRI